MSGWRGWTAGGGPYPLLGLFKLAMSLRSASYIGPNMFRGLSLEQFYSDNCDPPLKILFQILMCLITPSEVKYNNTCN